MGNSCKKKRVSNSATHKSVIELESRKSKKSCKHETKHNDSASKTLQNSEMKNAKLEIRKACTEIKESRNDPKGYAKSEAGIKNKTLPERGNDHATTEKIIKDKAKFGKEKHQVEAGKIKKDIIKSNKDITVVKSEKDLKNKKSEKYKISENNVKVNEKLEIITKVHDISEKDTKNYTKSKNIQTKKSPILLERNTSIPIQNVMPTIKQSKETCSSVYKTNEEMCVRRGFPSSECFPLQKIDRMMLRICPKYIGMKGCRANYCYRFHLCSYWTRGTCKRENCPHDHHFQSGHNQEMFQLVKSECFGEAELKIQLKRNFYNGNKIMEDLSPVICMNYILRQCKEENCDDIHINSPFSWEMHLNDKWSNFSKSINEEIESRFCNPFISEFFLDPSTHLDKASDSLRQDMVFLNKPIKINFDHMSLKTFDKVSCDIRRLTTLSDISSFKSVATRWVWYWKGSNSKWKIYSFAFVKKYCVFAFSDYIEKLYLKKVKKEFVFKFHPDDNCFKINLESMNQINISTSETTPIRRRPVSVQQSKK